jgi:hypothetical protein
MIFRRSLNNYWSLRYRLSGSLINIQDGAIAITMSREFWAIPFMMPSAAQVKEINNLTACVIVYSSVHLSIIDHYGNPICRN